MHCLLDNLQEAEAAIAGGESTEHHPPPRGATAALQGSLVYATVPRQFEQVGSLTHLVLSHGAGTKHGAASARARRIGSNRLLI